MWRGVGTRAASSWRLVIQPSSRACNPNSPKETFAPRVVSPFMWPRMNLRCLTRLGLSMGSGLLPDFVGIAVAADDFALADPHLHANRAGGGMCCSGCVVDVRTQSVQRNATVAVLLGTCNFGAAKTTRAHDLDAFGTQTHGSADRLLHGPA